MRENEALPTLLSLPTGSLTEFSKYVMRLLSKGKKTNSVVTKFSLKKAQNAGGINYSQAVFAVDRALTENEQAMSSARWTRTSKMKIKKLKVNDSRTQFQSLR